MKNPCPEVRNLLGPYLDAELAETERLKIEEHLKACPGCRQELAELETLHGVALKAAHPASSEEHLDRLRWQVSRRLRGESRPEGRISRLSPVSFFRLATLGGALVVMMVVVIAGYRLLGDRSARPGPLAEVELERRLTPVAPVETTPSRPALVAQPSSETAPAQPAATHSRAEVRARIAGKMLASEQARPYEEIPEPATSDLAESDLASGAGAEPPTPAARASAATATRMKSETSDEVHTVWKAASEEPVRSALDHSGLAGFVSWPRPDTLLTDTGTVELLLWVEPDSSVSSAKVLRSSGSPILDTFALRQALRARALPEFKDGKPVRMVRRAEFRQSVQQQDNQ